MSYRYRKRKVVESKQGKNRIKPKISKREVKREVDFDEKEEYKKRMRIARVDSVYCRYIDRLRNIGAF